MRIFVGLGWALFALGLGWLLGNGYLDVRVAGNGTISIPVLGSLVAAVVALVLTRWVPPRLPEGFPGEVAAQPRVGRQAAFLTGIALLFPALLWAVPGLGRDVGYLGLKLLLFFALPLVVLACTGGIRLPTIRPTGRWRWLGPAVVGVVFLAVLQGWPWTPSQPGIVGDPVELLVGVVLVFLTASVGEELFYRYLLQTRLEARLGRWPGILASSLLFPLMHLPTRLLVFDLATGVAAVVVVQGTFGLVMGYLWSRYRNFWALVAVHAGVNHLSLLWLM
ncbi:membrane protease YdiL (CAAX protease family) [Crossiella equi]|uniref:Membrane protease YdiL (CAAX protease family) n=1 Tax=Crossiella equi TaxID=130796 RepID=A0ABS5AJH7_9PSEU|nr:CPBP family intramembrane glutamic endopeptidase [Crossiella equi]MBP2476364.1 membrane protease YdiL (CAAX protease family) [Crossiella equi]